MAFTVQLYQFAKKANSTAYPPTSLDPFTFEGVLREGTSVLSPVFGFDFGAGGVNASQFGGAMPTWAIVAAPFSRCYFIKNWEYSDGLWWAYMTVDVLATYKINIGGYTGYIVRSTNNAAWDRRAGDTTYPPIGGTYSIFADDDSFWQKFAQQAGLQTDSPAYIVGVVNNATDTLRRGGVSYYAMTESQMQTFINVLLSSIDYANISTGDISESVAKLLLNPTQYIVSCTWFPSATWLFGSTLDNKTELPFGWWTLNGVGCRTMKTTTAALVGTWNFAIPKHPQANNYPYTQLEPYSRYTIHIPPWGDIAIEPGLLYGKSLLNISIESDPTASYAVLLIQDDEYNVLARYDGRIGVDVPLASMTVDQNIKSLASTQASNLLNTQFDVGGGLTASPMDFIKIGGAEISKSLQNTFHKVFGGKNAGDAGQAFYELYDAAANVSASRLANMVTVESSGIASSTSPYYERAYLRLDYINMAEPNDEKYGRPALRTAQISTIPGFIKVGRPDITLTATDTEVSAVNQLMAAGFWYE